MNEVAAARVDASAQQGRATRHKREVLAELGYVDRDIEQLKTAKVIR
jgi:hypothetical protein